MNAPMRLVTERERYQQGVIEKLELALELAKEGKWTFVGIVGEGPNGLRTIFSGQEDILRTMGALQNMLFAMVHEWHHET